MQWLNSLGALGLGTALAATTACGASITSRAVVSDPANRQCYFLQSDPMVAPDPPKRPYVVIGMIEVRADESAAVADLLNELAKRGRELCADAVIPASQTPSAARAPSNAGAYRPFYVAGSDSDIVLRAQGIHYSK